MLLGGTWAPALLPRARPCKPSTMKSPAGRLPAAEGDRQPSPTTTERRQPWARTARWSDGAGAITTPSPTPRLLPRLGGQDHRLRQRWSGGEQSALAAKSSANPDLFEGLGSCRAEPSGKVQVISGHYFPAL